MSRPYPPPAAAQPDPFTEDRLFAPQPGDVDKDQAYDLIRAAHSGERHWPELGKRMPHSSRTAGLTVPTGSLSDADALLLMELLAEADALLLLTPRKVTRAQRRIRRRVADVDATLARVRAMQWLIEDTHGLRLAPWTPIATGTE